MKDHTATIKKSYAFLALERRIVGIKLIYEKSEYDRIAAAETKRPISYCQAVKAATAGHDIKLTKELSGCAGSSRALGFVPPAPSYYTGESSYKLGLYADLAVAKNVANNARICTRPLYGVVVKPLEHFEVEPDIVMIIANTREAMRIMQGYTSVYGIQQEFNITGNQAICMECTTYPLIKQCINLSLLCSGTRHKTGWKDGEVAIGFPYSLLGGIVQGLQTTVNAIERNRRKAEIEHTLRQSNLYDLEIEYGRTYFLANDSSPKE